MKIKYIKKKWLELKIYFDISMISEIYVQDNEAQLERKWQCSL